MSKLEDFEDIAYEDEPRYTLKDVQKMIKQTETELKNKYVFDKLKCVEEEKDFYKGIIHAILQNKEYINGKNN